MYEGGLKEWGEEWDSGVLGPPQLVTGLIGVANIAHNLKARTKNKGAE